MHSVWPPAPAVLGFSEAEWTIAAVAARRVRRGVRDPCGSVAARVRMRRRAGQSGCAARLHRPTASSTQKSSTGASATGKYAALLAYSRCMRSHGVANFPDPKQVGGGIQVSGSAPGINPQSPLFMSAQQSCRHLLPGGGRPTRAGQQQALARMLHVSQCMRAHGIPGFPDPTLSPPSSRAGYSADQKQRRRVAGDPRLDRRAIARVRAGGDRVRLLSHARR